MKTIFVIFGVLMANVLAAGKSCNIPEKGEKLLLGQISPEALKDTCFAWFSEGYDDYQIPDSTAQRLKGLLKGISIKVVLGTWCSDTRLQIPRLIKILDDAQFPLKSLRMYAVGRDRRCSGYDAKSDSVSLIPTIILYENGAEKGRITESPKETIEKDLIDIISAIR